jgi:hypothetical protein
VEKCVDFERFRSNCRTSSHAALQSFSTLGSFSSGDQSVAQAMLAAHDGSQKIQRSCAASGFGARTICASFKTSQQGRYEVDLSLRLNALAVCAAFVFVGAVLLGAF